MRAANWSEAELKASLASRLRVALLLGSVWLTNVATPVAAPAATTAPDKLHFDLKRANIAAFIDARVKDGANREQLVAILSAAEPQPKIIETINRPAEKALQWWEYRARFMSDERIDTGVKLWRDRRELLEGIAHRARVSPQYILAILGVETFYGRLTGRYRVIDALSTLAFDYPERSAFFQSELTQYLQLASEEAFDPLVPLGSYAGAMGAAQFMPSSYRQYAVNAGDQPHRDLWNDWGDIFASVANYLARHGWQYGGAVLADATYTGSGAPKVPDKVVMGETLGSIRAQDISTGFGAHDSTPAMLLAAPLANGMSYRIGFSNFYVITRYNRSPLYAMAVSDLADAIAARFAAATTP
jgi:membrane-bound lytic murein transglycosylase B